VGGVGAPLAHALEDHAVTITTHPEGPCVLVRLAP
jgi:hypothetical protein